MSKKPNPGHKFAFFWIGGIAIFMLGIQAICLSSTGFEYVMTLITSGFAVICGFLSGVYGTFYANSLPNEDNEEEA